VIYSPDGRYLFATDENTAQVSVFDLRPNGTLQYAPEDEVGNLPVYSMPISMAFSADGQELYVTTWYSGNYPPGNVAASSLGGTLTVVDVARAEHNPTDPQAILAQPVVGCGPVRVVLALDGQTAWISSQWDDTVNALDLAKLRTDPQHAVLATIPVGPAPAGILLIKGGKELLVANTGRYDPTLSPQSVTVIDTQRALDGQPAVLGSIPEGLFPRDFALDGQTVVLTNFASQSVSLIDVATLP
jgi:DNA-binding beta-propeller fold protein YncE